MQDRVVNQYITLKDGREVVIREAVSDDAEGLFTLMDSIARERRWLLNYEAFWGVEGQRHWIESVRKSGGVTLVAEARDGALVGWAELSRTMAPLTFHTATLGMGVAASYRAVGLGKALLSLITQQARETGVEKLDLTVRSTNHAAIRLYESQGWRHEGVSPRAFKHNGEYEDRIHMGLWLGPG